MNHKETTRHARGPAHLSHRATRRVTRAARLALLTLLSAGALALTAPTQATAMCGAFVMTTAPNQPVPPHLYNDATQVVLMRNGTQTVLSMQNNYRGPAKDFAMIVPVPHVLTQDDVKTLKPEVFERLNANAAPSLMRFQEANPCVPDQAITGPAEVSTIETRIEDMGASQGGGVNVAASFAVGEYDVVILNATDSAGLAGWLKTNGYHTPDDIAAQVETYIQRGMYFFVAKVNPAKVTFRDGEAVLSPLRFAYTSSDLTLPLRLGLAHSPGEQDIIVHVFASARQEATNRPNATIPTGLQVGDDAAGAFGTFYEALFRKTLEKHPGAAITERAEPVSLHRFYTSDLYALGADLFDETLTENPNAMDLGEFLNNPYLYSSPILTRLHLRHKKTDAPDDLVLRDAEALSGGDFTVSSGGFTKQDGGRFVAQYGTMSAWNGAITCDDPVHGRWVRLQGSVTVPNPHERHTGELPRTLASYLVDDVPELEVIGEVPRPVIATPRPPATEEGGCSTGGGAGGAAGAGFGLFAALGMMFGWRRRAEA